MTWDYDPTALTKILESGGYDVDDSQARGLGGGGSLSARRDRPDATVTVAVDSGGRLKVMVTRPLGTAATDNATVDGLSLRILTEESHAETIATELDEAQQLASVLTYVDQGRASAAGGQAAPAAGESTANATAAPAADQPATPRHWPPR